MSLQERYKKLTELESHIDSINEKKYDKEIAEYGKKGRTSIGNIELVKRTKEGDVNKIMKNGKQIGTFFLDDGPANDFMVKLKGQKEVYVDTLEDVIDHVKKTVNESFLNEKKYDKEIAEYGKKGRTSIGNIELVKRTKEGDVNKIMKNGKQIGTFFLDDGPANDFMVKLKGQKEVYVDTLEDVIDHVKKTVNESFEITEDQKGELKTLLGEDVQDETIDKAAILFEAAVNDKVSEKVKEIKESYDEKLQEEVETLEEQVDKYLNYVTEKWMEENQLAVEQGIRNEISESFINDLKELFETHNINVPDEKIDMIDEMQETIDSLQEELNESINAQVDLKESLKAQKRDRVFNTVSSDLTFSQSEKLKEMTEDMSFDDEESFQKKLEVIKENYFGDEVDEEKENFESVSTKADGEDEGKKIDPLMEQYVNQLSRFSKN